MSKIPEDKMLELTENFKTIDADGNGTLDATEIKRALEIVGYNLPNYKVKSLMDELDVNKDGVVDFKEFVEMYGHLKSKAAGSLYTSSITPVAGVKTIESEKAGHHSVGHEERRAFSDWINRNLASDEDCKRFLPIDTESEVDLFDKCGDGILLCKMINQSAPGTIDERVINKGDNMIKFKKHENITLALNSARSIGCVVISVFAEQIEDGVQHLTLGVLWQIIKVGLFADINLVGHADLGCLLEDDETLDDLRKLSSDALLLRWVNYHLNKAGANKRIKNFGDDIKDSEAYAYLLPQIAPVDKQGQMATPNTVMSSGDNLTRAAAVLDNADILDARVFVTPREIANGHVNLNMAFVANLFNNYPALDKQEMPVEDDLALQETREEKTFRNWMNSIGVSPVVNYLYSDLTDGLILFQIYNIIKPGIVNYDRVHKKFTKLRMNFEILENCNYAVELGKELHFVLVGIDGSNLKAGDRVQTLGLVWQLMRAYTLAILNQLASKKGGSSISDAEIVQWANDKLSAAGKSSKMTSFKDPSLKDGRILADLVDSVSPNSVKYDMISSSQADEDRLANAKYVITLARRSGAKIYALPEDITEMNAKMIMTLVACLMIVDLEKEG